MTNAKAPSSSSNGKPFAGGRDRFVEVTTFGEDAREARERPSQHTLLPHRRVAEQCYMLPKGVRGVIEDRRPPRRVGATAATDAVGFYYFDSSVLKQGRTYSVVAGIPKGYKPSSPASQTFTWGGNALQLATFTLN